MVAEFASPKLSATTIDSCSQTETKERNIALVEPLRRSQQAIAEHPEITENPQTSIALAEADDQSLWGSFEEMMDSLEIVDHDEATETVAVQVAPLLSFPQTSQANLTLVSSQPESEATRAPVKGKLLPFVPRATEADFDQTPTWQEIVVALGPEIQRIRESQGLSLDQIRFQTQIPVYQLQFLESGSVEQLPEEIFVRGFIKRVCAQLGEEGQALLAQIPAPKQEQQEILAQWQQQQGANSNHSQVVQLRSAHLYVGYATLLAGAAGGLAWSFQDTAQVNPAPGSPQPTAQKSGAQARLNPAQQAVKLAFGSDVARPEQSAPELMP